MIAAWFPTPRRGIAPSAPARAVVRAFHLDEPADLSVRLRVEADSGCAIAAAQLRPALAADMPAKQRRTLMVGLTRAVRDTFKSLGLPADASPDRDVPAGLTFSP